MSETLSRSSKNFNNSYQTFNFVYLHMSQVMKLLLPIWVMLFVFQPVPLIMDSDDLIPALSDDGVCLYILDFRGIMFVFKPAPPIMDSDDLIPALSDDGVCLYIRCWGARWLCFAPLWWGDILFLSCPSHSLSAQLLWNYWTEFHETW